MGSLFKLRDFWTQNLSEDFSSSAMILSNVDNEKSGATKIVVGSFQGVLRVLQPKSKNPSPDDVLFEKKFPEPILQVLAGPFIPVGSSSSSSSGSGKTSLAILFPKRLLIVMLTRRASTSSSSSKQSAASSPAPTSATAPPDVDPLGAGADFFLQCLVHREHLFEHIAYNMVSGPFGNASAAVDSICVQSMDGQLTFVDHQKLLFQRFLPSTHFLVPGYLQYNPKSDSFLTSSSSLELHSYKYFTIAQSTGSESKDSPQGGRKLAPDWSFNVGEDVMDIQCCRLTRGLAKNQSDIVVLCERTLFVLKDNGEIRFNKRLDMPVVCLCPFAIESEDASHNLIVGTATENMMVYSDSTLLWSAKMAKVPISIAVGTVGGVEGMIVTLSQDGSLSLNYLGTDPASNPVQPLESKELDYDAMDEEHRKLQQVIRQAVNNTLRTEHDTVTMKVEPPSVIHFPQRTCSVVVGLTLNGVAPSKQATLVTTVGEPLTVDHPTYLIDSLLPNETVFVTLHFHSARENESVPPCSLLAEFVLCFTSSTGQPLTSRATVTLPYGLVAMPVPALKNAQFKVQVDTNKAPPPSLQELFHDLTMFGEVQPNVLSVKYLNGMDATVLVSKNAGRYRVQSSSFEGLWLLTSELVRRLRVHYKEDRTEALRIDVPEPLPVEDYFMVIDTHMTMRVELREANEKLARVTQLFRAIQKRLLVRFRDRTPASLASLELLFEETYRKLHVCADAVDHANNRLKQAGSMLSSGTHLMLLLVRYKHQDTFSKEDWDALRQYLSPLVLHTVSGIGWEEVTDANLTHLLRTALSKNVRESGSAAQPLVESLDASKVKKHLTIVLDRIAKGSSILEAKQLTSVEVVEGRRPAPASS